MTKPHCDARIGENPSHLFLSGDIEVNLQMVGDASFRFFGNYRFSFASMADVTR